MKKKKIALLFVCLNERYWPYLKNVINDCDNLFFTNRRSKYEVDYFAWTDLPEGTTYGATIIPTDPAPWPHPTLMRYHLFLQEEEKLKDYDYIFYLDADMRIVAPIGEEILGKGLTMAEHPMYALAKKYYPPYEPNKESSAYIPRFGTILDEGGKPRFKPLYAAGGFQGGTAETFITAMKAMRKSIDEDFAKNYIAIWNDESHWNKYLSTYTGPLIVLSPSYVYPDSLIKEYYEPIWGCSYQPKIMTLTKPFTLSKAGGDHLRKELGLPELPAPFVCPICGDSVQWEGVRIEKVVKCQGKGKPHEVEGKKL